MKMKMKMNERTRPKRSFCCRHKRQKTIIACFLCVNPVCDANVNFEQNQNHETKFENNVSIVAK